jgi:hypothetical protein
MKKPYLGWISETDPNVRIKIEAQRKYYGCHYNKWYRKIWRKILRLF